MVSQMEDFTSSRAFRVAGAKAFEEKDGTSRGGTDRRSSASTSTSAHRDPVPEGGARVFGGPFALHDRDRRELFLGDAVVFM